MVNSQLSHEIIRVFNTVFSASEGTVLSGGAAEPFYEPGDPATCLLYTSDAADD